MPAHPVTVAAYLVDSADTRTETGERAYAVATFGTWIAAINHQHRATGHLSPSAHELVTATLSGVRREYAAADDRPRRPRDPLPVDDIKILVSTARERCRGWADDVLERRHSAILLHGFAGAYRRGELSDLVCGDVTLHRLDSLHVRLRKSKTDQEGRGAVKALPYTESHETCPPCAHVRWAQVVAAFDAGGRPSVIRLLRKQEPFDGHICRQSSRLNRHPNHLVDVDHGGWQARSDSLGAVEKFRVHVRLRAFNVSREREVGSGPQPAARSRPTLRASSA